MKEVVDLDDEVPNHTKYIHCNNLIYFWLKPLTLKNLQTWENFPQFNLGGISMCNQMVTSEIRE